MQGANPPTALAAAAPCITSATISAVAGSIAAGIATAGAAAGFTFINPNTKIGERDIKPLIHTKFGVSHHFDLDTHKLLHYKHGGMLDSHNTTLISVTWLEKLPSANHTGGPFEALNMTEGRLLTLNDNGMIRTALGHINAMDRILDSFNDFKGNNGKGNPLTKRQTSEVNFITYNTFGLNPSEIESDNAEGIIGITDLNAAEGADGVTNFADFDAAFMQTNSAGETPEKLCVSAGPQGSAVGQNSFIIGEMYQNQFGGIDQSCQDSLSGKRDGLLEN